MKAPVRILACGLFAILMMCEVDLTPSQGVPFDTGQVFNFGSLKTLPSETGAQDSPSGSVGDKAEGHFNPIILAASDMYEVDPALVKAIIMAESEYNPAAISKQGARGLMQLMPNTAHALGVKDSFDPELNIYGGVKHLKELLNRFEGDPILAVAAYNAGSQNVKRYNGVPPYGATWYYVKKVFHYYRQYGEETGQGNNGV